VEGICKQNHQCNATINERVQRTNHVAVSSNENSNDTTTLCLFPNASLKVKISKRVYHPMSAYVIRVRSTSIQRARMRAVYNVTRPLNESITPPRTQPLYLNANGKDSNPIPTRILTELKTVCASVLYNELFTKSINLSHNHLYNISRLILNLLYE
jgi:hypothetical protein